MKDSLTNHTPIRVLHTDVGEKDFGGVPAVLLSLHAHIDHSRFMWDFLSPGPTEKTYDTRKQEIAAAGGHIDTFNLDKDAIRPKLKLWLQYVLRMRKFLKASDHDIVHINTGAIKVQAVVSWLAKHVKRFPANPDASVCAHPDTVKDPTQVDIRAAKRQHPYVVCHSHNANSNQNALKKWLRRPLKMIIEKNADVLIGCSGQAAYFLFRKKTVDAGGVYILNNGIKTQRFAYDPAVREAVRKELALGDCLAIGHVGRLSEQKNHTFLFEVFAAMLCEHPDALLFCVGSGELEMQLKAQTKARGIAKSVRFLGPCADVERLYQAFDMMIFPSLFEGLPVAVVEAQAAGLPCVVSEAVPKEAVVTDLVTRLPLSLSAGAWAQKASVMLDNAAPRISRAEEVAAAGYDVARSAKELEQLYAGLVAAAGQTGAEKATASSGQIPPRGGAALS